MRTTSITRVVVTISLFLSVEFDSSVGEKILFFFGGGSYSHKYSAWYLATELADRGHEVTFISAHSKKPSNHTGVRDLSSEALRQLMSKSYDVDRFYERQIGDFHSLLLDYAKISTEICETTLLKSDRDLVLQKLIHNSTFDLVFINIIFGECGFAFAHNYKAKSIVYDASVPLSWFYDVYGYHAEISWVPDIIPTFEKAPISFLGRMKSAFWNLHWFYDRYNNLYPELERIMMKAFGDADIPSFYELERNASLILLNTHHSFNFANALPPFVIPMGGINTFLPAKDIPREYKEFMDAAGPEGVVFVSFGSTIRLEKVPYHYQKIFFELVKKHNNVRFLLKWEGPYPQGYEKGLNNLLTSGWFPQTEILTHPKIQAFITHGGLNSIQEATYNGVPMIVMPLFADQDHNAYRIQAQDVGFALEIADLTFAKLDAALSEMLRNKKYKKNMEVKSRLYRDRPQSPLETAVYWTEFVLRHDDFTSLKPMSGHLTWYQRRLLDVYLAYALILSSAIFVLSWLLIRVYKRLLSIPIPSTPKKKLS